MLPVIYMPVAEKYFKKLKEKKLKDTFKEAIMSIRKNPDIGYAKSGDLSGIYCLDIYYNQTNYELAYRISQLENDDMVVIIMAGTRESHNITAFLFLFSFRISLFSNT